jgi:hypothetical protein
LVSRDVTIADSETSLMQREPSFQEVIDAITPITVNGRRWYKVEGQFAEYSTPRSAQNAAREMLRKKLNSPQH